MCVVCVCLENRETHGKTNYSTSPLCLGECRGGKTLQQTYGQINTFFFNNTLWFHSKYISTWTSIQLPCLCNVSFTEPGPLADSRPDPVFVSGRKDGVEEHPPSKRKREFETHIMHFASNVITTVNNIQQILIVVVCVASNL